MVEEKVNFRGINDGINIEIESNSLEAASQLIYKKLNGSMSFYRGANLLEIKSQSLSNRDIIELTFILKYKYGFKVDYGSIDKYILDKGEDKEELKASLEAKLNRILKESLGQHDESKTKFINRTIRSGQSIDYEGSIVVVGDVNPGAIIKAKYNIIVLGSFRGVGYAGKDGDLESIVAAYKLDPTQLRIGDKIARAPDKKLIEDNYRLPEIARVINDKLIIEPYLPNK